MPHPVRRVAALLLISSVAVATQAAPAAAATTRDVAPTGKGGGSCATPDHRTIAAAIKASKKGDTILVCPGTYKGALYIGKAGLTIKATKAGKARITTGKPDDESIIWIDGAPSVTLRGLRLVAPTTGCTAPDQHHRDRRGDHGCDQRRPLHGRCDRVARVRNDARNSGGLDCQDDSDGGSGSNGTDNTWTQNLGLDMSPSGICSAPV